MAKLPPTPTFRKKICQIPAWKGKSFGLHQSTWDLKRSLPERRHLVYNFDAVQRACANPVEVRRSTKNRKSYIFYESLPMMRMAPDQEMGFNGFMAVVVIDEKWIQTMYPTRKIKAGEVIYAKS